MVDWAMFGFGFIWSEKFIEEHKYEEGVEICGELYCPYPDVNFANSFVGQIFHLGSDSNVMSFDAQEFAEWSNQEQCKQLVQFALQNALVEPKFHIFKVYDA
jgi:hypothetical protein